MKERLVQAAAALLLCACGPALDSDADFDPAGDGLEEMEQEVGPPSVQAVTDAQALPEMLRVVGGATRRLDIAAFEYAVENAGLRTFNDALRAAAARGVRVRVLLDDSVPVNRTAVGVLRAMGVDAKLDSTLRTTHNKFILADGKVLFAGSTNLSTWSLQRNHETDVVVRLQSVGTSMSRYFESLWSNSAPKITVGATSSRTAQVLGDGQYAPAARALIDRARREVQLVMYTSRYHDGSSQPRDGLVDALVAAAARGARVRVVLDQGTLASITTENRKVAARLRQGGVDVRFDPAGVITHAKLLVVDDVAITGSTNWTDASLTEYHATDIKISRVLAVAAFRSYFELLWSGSTP